MSTTPTDRAAAGADDYDAAVAALLARPVGAADRDRLTLLSELLGRPDQALAAIHVAGDVGKTSTAALLTGLLRGLQLGVGTAVSPHLQELRERIRLDGRPLDADRFAERYDELAPYLLEVDARTADPLTVAEAVTAVAFAEFADAPAEVAVYEAAATTGWDPASLARAEVAVVTPLVDESAEALRALPGRVGPGVTIVSAAQPRAVTEALTSLADERGARLLLAGRDMDVMARQPAVGGQLVSLRGVTGDVDDALVPLHGAHQADNALLALVALEALLGLAGGLDPEVLREALASVRAPGRLEVVGRGSDQAPVALDVADTPTATRALARALADEFAPRRRVAVVGAEDGADVDRQVAALADVVDVLVATAPPVAGALPADALARRAVGHIDQVEVAEDVAAALERASALADQPDLVVVTGAAATVGAARSALGLEPA